MATGRVGEGQGLRRTSQASRQMVQSLLGNSWANLVGLVLDPRMTVPRCDSRGLRTQAQPRQDWGAFNPTWTGLPGKVSGLQIRSKGQGPTPTIQGEVLTLAPGRRAAGRAVPKGCSLHIRMPHRCCSRHLGRCGEASEDLFGLGSDLELTVLCFPTGLNPWVPPALTPPAPGPPSGSVLS